MKVKKFKAKDMPEAMKKIRAELGDDAVILNSKHVNTGGFLGLFTKKSIEVIAAIDEYTLPVRRSRNRTPRPKEMERNEVLETPRKEHTKDVQKEVYELKEMIASLKRETAHSLEGYPASIQAMDNALRDQEINETIRYELLRKLLSDWYKAEYPNANMMLEKTKTFLSEKMQEADFGPSVPVKKIINLVGPTGVGKTTTIAKIAAYYLLEKKLSVGFITTDTYRIAAIEQLKTYAKILNIPIEVAYSLEDFQLAKENFQQKDLILVDSAGRNFQNALYVKELQKIIDFDADMDTYLVLALTSKYKDMKNIYEQFSLIPIDKFIFTKKDETVSFGAILNMIAETSIGAAYITDGQNVPDDMQTANPNSITDWVLEEAGYE